MVKVILPTGLQSLTIGAYFNQIMEKMNLPTGSQSRIFLEFRFDPNMEKVSLPTCLQSRL